MRGIKKLLYGGCYMDIEFSSLEELYKRLKPALTTKCDEMKMQGYTYIKEEDIAKLIAFRNNPSDESWIK
jgi:hypothetical protein